MAMNVGSEEGDDVPVSDINVTPLVDVMLVLLIIMLIAIPVVAETVPLTLPKVVHEATVTKPENVSLSVRADEANNCEIYWGMTRVNSQELLDRSVQKLEEAVELAGGAENLTEETLPEAHIRGDVNTPYRCIGGAIYTMQRAGFARVGFISEPPVGYAPARL